MAAMKQGTLRIDRNYQKVERSQEVGPADTFFFRLLVFKTVREYNSVVLSQKFSKLNVFQTSGI